MKKLLLVLLILTAYIFTLTSCETNNVEKKYKTIVCEDLIVDKEIKNERNNFATWFFDKPLNETVYYFSLKEYGERKVSKKEYNSYKIGDIYKWEERVEE